MGALRYSLYLEMPAEERVIQAEQTVQQIRARLNVHLFDFIYYSRCLLVKKKKKKLVSVLKRCDLRLPTTAE